MFGEPLAQGDIEMGLGDGQRRGGGRDIGFKDEGYGFEERWTEMLNAAEALEETAKTLGHPPSYLARAQALAVRIRSSQDPLARPLRQHLERHWPELHWNE